MRNVTSSFKTAIREPRQIDGKVIVGSQTLTSDVINQIIPKFNASLFKTVMKGVEIDSNTSISIGTNINPQFALFVNNSFEWVDYGNYKVYKSEKNEDTLSYKITAYDKILESMIDYDLEVTYPITVRNYWIAIFTKLNWNTTGIPVSFTNSTKMINQDVHSGIGYTYRDVLDELCTISGVWLVDKNGIPSIVSPNETNETIDETYMKDTNVTIKDKVFFNSLVFSRVEGSDNIYRKDDTSIEQNGLHEFKISDNQLLSTNDRDLYIDELWNYIKTFEYYSFEIDTVGIVFLEALDKFNLSVNNQNYSTILLNDETYISQGLTETIYSESPTEMQTEYKYADTSDKKLDQVYITVNKQGKRIDAVVSTQNEQGESIAQLQLDTESIQMQVIDVNSSLNLIDDTLSTINSTILEQTSEQFEMLFNSTGIQDTLDELQGLVDNQNTTLDEIRAYIRFGTINDTTSPYYGSPYIELGKEDSNTKLRILDNRIQFLTGENETAYISNNTLYINESTVLTKQTMGTESTGFWITEVDSEGNQNTRWGGN